jgi:group I intron endonuclease
VAQGVYVWLNTANGKVYVGSSTDVGRRKRSHLTKLTSGKHESRHFQNAWHKDGASFEFELLEVVPDRVWLRARETAWIIRLQATNPTFGYNSATDGWNPTSLRLETRAKLSTAQSARHKRGNGHRFTSEEKEKQRYTLKQKWADPVWRVQLLEKRKRQWTPEARAKKSVSAKGQWTPEHRKAQADRLFQQKIKNPEMPRLAGFKGAASRWKKEKA